MIFDDYQDQPREISIETQAICNAACTFCPYPTIERKGLKMADKLIDRLIEEMKGFKKPFYFSPFKVSDPLLDKRIFDIIAKVNKANRLARTRIFTNGSALNPINAEKLNKLGNLEVFISLNEYRPSIYKDLMGLDFEKVTRNIDLLHDSDFRHPVYILRVGVDPAFREYAEARWPRFITVQVKKDGWLGYTDPDPNEDIGKCSRWLELSIMANGIVSLCCMDAEGRYSIGDVNKETMMEVYNRWTYRKHKDRAGLVPCETCTY